MNPTEAYLSWRAGKEQRAYERRETWQNLMDYERLQLDYLINLARKK